MSSRLVSLPYEILQEIVLQVVLPEDGKGGPPSGLIPILLTCRALNRRLSHNTNPHLYHSIACAQFDLDAARRRSLSSKRPLVLTASVLSQHLRHTWLALHRLRHADVDSPDLHDDLWDAFLLASENDGRNIPHLRWANVHALTERFLAHKMWRESETDDGGWPRDSPLAALAAWVFWATTDRRELESFDMDRRQATVQMILPFVLVSFKYPRFFAPDLAFDLPLPADVRPRLPPPSQPNAHGEYPVFRRPSVHSRVRFGRRITLAPPPLPSAASLVFFTVRSLIPVVVPSTIPVDRQAAIAAGVTGGQTQADLHELNASGLTQLFPVGGREPSRLWDDDLKRMKTCLDPWAPMPKWKGSPYTPGTLNGLFCGRYLVPDVEGYMSLLGTPTYPEGFGEFAPFTSMWPVYMRLVEHHSISPAQPVPSARNVDDPVDCGVHNAWFPNTVHFLRSSATNVLHVDADGSRYEYETFVPGKPNSHDPSTCGNCVARASSLSAPSKARSSCHPPGFDEEAEKMFEAEGVYDEDEDEDGDDVGDVFAQDGKCTGIQDIVITGETDPTHGAAWGHYVILGRVRRRDGLVVLLRVPKVPGRPRWVFRGLVHAGSTIVGAWRGAVNVHGQARAVPWEGAFAMTRRVEDVPSAGPSSVNSTASV